MGCGVEEECKGIGVEDVINERKELRISSRPKDWFDSDYVEMGFSIIYDT